jgi:hypothetical protein
LIEALQPSLVENWPEAAAATSAAIVMAISGSPLAALAHPPAFAAISAALLICPTGAIAVKQAAMSARAGSGAKTLNVIAVSNMPTLRQTAEQNEVMPHLP